MSNDKASALDHAKSWPLAFLPHKLLSRLVRAAARWRTGWWKTALIKLFIRVFDVDMSEARLGADEFPDFNSFFTRELKPGARNQPVDTTAVTSPVDGRVSEAGDITAGQLVQAKGHYYSLTTLLGTDSQYVEQFQGGKFATLYLSPRDYHRIHMPCDGRLVETSYIPGRLYSVAAHTTRAIPGLFTRNERLVCMFDTPVGPMALVMVGAIFVSCMETVWSGIVNPALSMQQQNRQYPQGQAIDIPRGTEMGRFNMGSTVILLYAPGQLEWVSKLQAGYPVQLGNTIGHPVA